LYILFSCYYYYYYFFLDTFGIIGANNNGGISPRPRLLIGDTPLVAQSSTSSSTVNGSSKNGETKVDHVDELSVRLENIPVKVDVPILTWNSEISSQSTTAQSSSRSASLNHASVDSLKLPALHWLSNAHDNIALSESAGSTTIRGESPPSTPQRLNESNIPPNSAGSGGSGGSPINPNPTPLFILARLLEIGHYVCCVNIYFYFVFS
jgi:hypothetical protein